MAGDSEIYGRLLSIKRYREEQAELELVRRKWAHKEAVEARQEEEKRLEGFQKEGKKVEDELYGDLCSKIVQLRDIEDVNHAMARIQKREVSQKKKVEEATKTEKKEISMLEGARSALVTASRRAGRFNELVLESWVKREKELAAKEEQEMEESFRYSREGDDDGQD